jgi:hypothetical protein
MGKILGAGQIFRFFRFSVSAAPPTPTPIGIPPVEFGLGSVKNSYCVDPDRVLEKHVHRPENWFGIGSAKGILECGAKKISSKSSL